MDKLHGEASTVFEDVLLLKLRSVLSTEALETPVYFSDSLSNRVLAVHLTLQKGLRQIIVNVRFKMDPELLAHTLIEEYVHAQQVLDDVDVAGQCQQFPNYEDRPYEQEAKRIATEMLGYNPKEYEVLLVREEPLGFLYDRPTPRANQSPAETES